MSTVTIDALDAVELTEDVEYFLERLDVLGEHGLAAFLFTECSPSGRDDLRADTTRLIGRLTTAR